MFLHENRWSFKETLKLASEETGIPPAIIEQDYFQTLLLQHISLIEKTPITLGVSMQYRRPVMVLTGRLLCLRCHFCMKYTKIGRL